MKLAMFSIVVALGAFLVGCLLATVIGCNIISGNGGSDDPVSVTDTEVNGPSDTETAPQEGSNCERACSGFEFTSCQSVIMKALPIGKFLIGDGCIVRCEHMVKIYNEIPYENIDFECLWIAGNCPAVAACLKITN